MNQFQRLLAINQKPLQNSLLYVAVFACDSSRDLKTNFVIIYEALVSYIAHCARALLSNQTILNNTRWRRQRHEVKINLLILIFQTIFEFHSDRQILKEMSSTRMNFPLLFCLYLFFRISENDFYCWLR